MLSTIAQGAGFISPFLSNMQLADTLSELASLYQEANIQIGKVAATPEVKKDMINRVETVNKSMTSKIILNNVFYRLDNLQNATSIADLKTRFTDTQSWINKLSSSTQKGDFLNELRSKFTSVLEAFFNASLSKVSSATTLEELEAAKSVSKLITTEYLTSTERGRADTRLTDAYKKRQGELIPKLPEPNKGSGSGSGSGSSTGGGGIDTGLATTGLTDGQATANKSNVALYLGIGVGVLALSGLGYMFFKR